MRNARVVLVDDDVNARIIAETLLQLRDLEVHAVGDASQACEVIGRMRADLLIVDLAVEGMPAYEIIRRVRGRFGPIPLPVCPPILAIGSNVSRHTERFTLRLGADAVLRKPLDARRFIDTVESLLAQGPKDRTATAR